MEIEWEEIEALAKMLSRRLAIALCEPQYTMELSMEANSLLAQIREIRAARRQGEQSGRRA